MSRVLLRCLSVAVFLAALVLLAACGGQEEAGGASLVVTATEYAFEVPPEVEAGFVTILMENAGREPHHLQLVRLNDGVTIEAFQAALQTEAPEEFGMITFEGGTGVTQPGQTSLITTSELAAGEYLAMSFLPDAEGVPEFARGMIAPFTVTGDEMVGAAPQPDATIHLSDFHIELPGDLAAGEQVWRIVNDGPQPHEMAILRLAEGKTVNDVTAFFSDPAGAAPFEEIGGLQGITVGDTAYLHTNFEPGTYVALCFIPDSTTGLDHASLGMIHEFTLN